MFTSCKTRMNKNVTPVVQRIKAKQDGRPFLRRNEQSYEPGTTSNNPDKPGPQKIGDLEEVFEDSSSLNDGNNQSESDDEDVNQIMDIGDDDEPVGSSELSNDYNRIKSILKNGSQQ